MRDVHAAAQAARRQSRARWLRRRGVALVAMAAVPVLAAVSAPSSLAVELAQEVGITLIGFLRGDGCNVYTHPERLVLDQPGASVSGRRRGAG